MKPETRTIEQLAAALRQATKELKELRSRLRAIRVYATGRRQKATQAKKC